MNAPFARVLIRFGNSVGASNNYFVRSNDTPFTGTAPGCYPIVQPGAGCGNSQGQLPLRGDTSAVVSRGRELMLRVSYRFGS